MRCLVIFALFSVSYCLLDPFPMDMFKLDWNLNLMKIFGRDAIPSEFMKAIDTLNDKEKKELVNLMNLLRKDDTKMPASEEEAAEFIKKHAPNFGAKAEKVMDEIKPKFEKMKPETQEVFANMAKDIFGASKLKADMREFELFGFIGNLPDRWEKLPAEIKDDVKANYPQLAKFMTSGMLKQMAGDARFKQFLVAGNVGKKVKWP